ncbi:unnamed protein product, partial [Sphagnum balticum]
MFNPKGVTHRIVKDEHDITVWEVFCRVHASSVHEPVKPKVKAKSQPILINIPAGSSSSSSSMGTGRGDRNGQLSKQSKSLYSYDDDDSDYERKPKSKSHGKGTGKGTGKTFSKTPSLVNTNNSPSRATNDRSQFPILTLSEWPGQSDGEGIDLDHFWRYSSTAFVEDHNREDESEQQYLDMTDKEKQAAVDIEKRNHFLNAVYRDIEVLRKGTDQTNAINASKSSIVDEELMFLTKFKYEDSKEDSEQKEEIINQLRVIVDASNYRKMVTDSQSGDDVIATVLSEIIDQIVQSVATDRPRSQSSNEMKIDDQVINSEKFKNSIESAVEVKVESCNGHDETLVNAVSNINNLIAIDLKNDESIVVAATSAGSNSEKESNMSILPDILTCTSCGVTVHTRCLQSLSEIPFTEISRWKCNSCLKDDHQRRCILCPRVGGLLLGTSTDQWAHVFCARYCPGQVRIIRAKRDEDDPKQIKSALIDIRNLPKENRKCKCSICNRKVGICEKCSVEGCGNYFHPLCAERSGRGFIRTRFGITEIYCSDHIPEGVDRITYRGVSTSGVHSLNRLWIDGNELQRLRYTLDRTRLIIDSITRRERHKRLLNKADGEFFTLKFQRLLDKAK